MRFLICCCFFLITVTFQSTNLNAKPWKSGEIISNEEFLFGAFEARLQASIGSGGITAFFLLKEGSWIAGNEWQELDIEVFGKSNGYDFQSQIMTPGEPRTQHKQNHRSKTNLSQNFHTYRIEWSPDYLAFYFDGNLIRRETDRRAYAKFLDRNRVEPMRLRLSLWAGFSDWSGHVDSQSLPTPVLVDFVRYYKFDEDSRNFTFAWEDGFDTFDAGRWHKANWTFEYAVNDFSPDYAFVKDGVLNLVFGR